MQKIKEFKNPKTGKKEITQKMQKGALKNAILQKRQKHTTIT